MSNKDKWGSKWVIKIRASKWVIKISKALNASILLYMAVIAVEHSDKQYDLIIVLFI